MKEEVEVLKKVYDSTGHSNGLLLEKHTLYYKKRSNKLGRMGWNERIEKKKKKVSESLKSGRSQKVVLIMFRMRKPKMLNPQMGS